MWNNERWLVSPHHKSWAIFVVFRVESDGGSAVRFRTVLQKMSNEPLVWINSVWNYVMCTRADFCPVCANLYQSCFFMHSEHMTFILAFITSTSSAH